MPAKKKLHLTEDLQALRKEFQDKYKDSVVFHNFADDPVEFQIVPTGIPTIDWCWNGGLKVGGIHLLAGMFSSGKTQLALQASKGILKLDPSYRLLYADSENSLDNKHLENTIGLDAGRVDRVKAQDLETMVNVLCQELIPNPAYKIIVWDTPYNMLSQEELSKDAEQRSRANMALVFSTEIKRINQACDFHNTAIIIIAHVSQNQERANKYSPRFIIPGGERLKHNCDLITMMSGMAKVKAKKKNRYNYDNVNGRTVKLVTEKCKWGPDWKTGTLLRLHDTGFDMAEDIFYVGSETGILEGKRKKSYQDQVLGSSREDCITFLRDHPDLCQTIAKDIMEHFDKNIDKYTTDEDTSFITDEDIKKAKKKAK